MESESSPKIEYILMVECYAEGRAVDVLTGQLRCDVGRGCKKIAVE